MSDPTGPGKLRWISLFIQWLGFNRRSTDEDYNIVPTISFENPDDGDEDVDLPGSIVIPIDGELDLHTFRPNEAGNLVIDYLDRCREKNITRVRIVHGKGKGQLRRTVHATLKRIDYVLNFHLADPYEGGWGATIVTIADRNRDE